MSLDPAQQLLLHMEVPDRRGVFALGCFERRVTLLSQQMRALNLVWALFQEGRLSSGKRVAVVGGGVGGLTAAAAAALKGCHVTLLEKQPELLHLLQGNHTRWVHPHIYDWPADGSEEPTADVPILNWEAGSAGDVAVQILDQWHELASSLAHPIDVQRGARDVTLVDRELSLTWNARDDWGRDKFDAIVLAIGFGVESTIDPVPLLSYWRDDSLHQHRLDPRAEKETYLISGCGDGGLTDLLRVRLTQFRHELLVAEFLSERAMDPVKRRLLEIEASPERTNANWLTDEYLKLAVPPELDERIASRLRVDTTVMLNGPGPTPLSVQSSVLNRFLVSRLLRRGVRYLPGKIGSIERRGAGYRVCLKQSDGGPDDFEGKPYDFDRVVIRHGAAPSVKSEFPSLWERCRPLRERNVFDETREQAWAPEFYPRTTRLALRNPDERPTRAERFAVGRPLAEILDGDRTLELTRVVPRRFEILRMFLRTAGKCLLVEGPQSAGKRTAVRAALIDAGVPSSDVRWVSGAGPADAPHLAELLAEGPRGYVVLTDAHALGPDTLARIVDGIAARAAAEVSAGKLVLLGPRSLTAAIPRAILADAVDVFEIDRQQDDDVRRLITLAERAGNVVFAWRQSFVAAARGSFWAAQQMCSLAMRNEGHTAAPAKLTTISVEPSQIFPDVMGVLHRRYRDDLRALLDVDAASPGGKRGAGLALLALLPVHPAREVAMAEAKRRYPGLAASLAWLAGGPLADAIARREALRWAIHYDASEGVLRGEDLQLDFYLHNLPWTEIGADIGVSIGIGADGALLFR